MKVIDLLNKIANGETKEEIMFQYNNGYEEYANINTLFDRFTINEENLNTEIEIIEEDKKIEKITLLGEEIKLGLLSNWLKNETINEKKIVSCIEANAMKINEIIDKLNKGE